jgi:ABC-type transport system involved in multi-copper enzyme maturation permease subunit
MRSLRTPIIIAVFLVVVGAAGYLSYADNPASSSDPRFASQAGTHLFRALALTDLLLVVLITPAITASTISGERERQTLDLLLCTPLRSRSIVLGKLASSLLFPALLLVSTLPLFALVFFLGGVTVAHVLVVMLVFAVTAVLVATIGLFLSVTVRRTIPAVLASYVAILVVGLLPVVLGFFGPGLTSTRATGYAPVDCSSGFCQPASPPSDALVVLASASPLTAAATAITAAGTIDCGTTSPALPANAAASVRMASAAVVCDDADRIAVGRLTGRRIWQVSTIVSLLLIVPLLAGATLALRGRRRQMPAGADERPLYARSANLPKPDR